ncbi:hypothetical protein C8J56DRAFT_892420 [Mycena floridula]|nr:hypothetical protein C8J56DRAFT_892420 [Mycena floridula]
MSTNDEEQFFDLNDRLHLRGFCHKIEMDGERESPAAEEMFLDNCEQMLRQQETNPTNVMQDHGCNAVDLLNVHPEIRPHLRKTQGKVSPAAANLARNPWKGCSIQGLKWPVPVLQDSRKMHSIWKGVNMTGDRYFVYRSVGLRLQLFSHGHKFKNRGELPRRHCHLARCLPTGNQQAERIDELVVIGITSAKVRHVFCQHFPHIQYWDYSVIRARFTRRRADLFE